MYLILALTTCVFGLIGMLWKQVSRFYSYRPLEYEKRTVRGKPAMMVGAAYAIVGLIFTLDALRVMIWGGRGFLWLFCTCWVLLGIISGLYMQEYYDDENR